ncbi:MAG: cytochrome c oxidase subunit I [Planctomycetaceae bacterium]|nr:MAG: cytochrome c oxidase subunit I [Planctomycetaceae bacterium]
MRLQQTWAPARGFPGVLAEVNNQIIGKRFMITAFVFFMLGGVLALLMRIQLAASDNHFLGPQTYNELFTMHGSTMMFLFAVPFLEGLALYLLPMMIGARDVAFPRLTAYGYWLYLFGGVLFYASFLFGAVPDIGWFGYTPLSTSRFTGLSTDFWLLGLSLVEVAGLTAAIEIVVTILKFRAPGMTIGRLPLFILSLLVVGVMILIAFTVLLTATVLLELDRATNTAFFDVERGGNNLLWQHLFWFFGHPEVYIMFLPATGIISMVIPVFARRPVVGYVLIAAAILVTGFVSFGLWVHHMFAAGLPALSMTFFTAASLMIAIASGVQVFAWIATLWGSRPELKPPFLFALGFMFLFVLGGLTGVMVAVVPFDQQVHDTYFIVAHFHYVLIGGVLFPIFSGVYYWLPKMTGRLFSDSLGRLNFWLTFIGFNLTFFPMHIMGFLGMPRRVYTYPRHLELDGYNLLSTFGAGLMSIGAVVFLYDLVRGLTRGEAASDNPWDGDSLEWSVSSPPPNFGFIRFPVVTGRHPLWQADVTEAPDDSALGRLREALAFEPQTWRGTMVTDATDATPQAIQYLASPTFVPMWAAVGTLAAAVGVLAQAYILSAAGLAVLIISVFIWLLPRESVMRRLRESELPASTGLPVLSSGSVATGWWGMVGFLTLLGSSFAALIYSYFYIRLFSPQWPPSGSDLPNLPLGSAAYACLVVAGVIHCWGMSRFRAAAESSARAALVIGSAVAVGFLALQGWDWSRQNFTHQSHAYGSLYFVISGTLSLLVVLGLAFSLTCLKRIGRTDRRDLANVTLHLEMTQMLWATISVIGVLVFLTLYATPYLL